MTTQRTPQALHGADNGRPAQRSTHAKYTLLFAWIGLLVLVPLLHHARATSPATHESRAPRAAPVAETVVWSEDWEGNWFLDWTVEAGTWEVGEPTSGPGACFDPSDGNCAATVLDGNYADGVDTRLISDPVMVPAASEYPRLRFWHWFRFGGGDNGEVQVSTDGGNTWDTISPVYESSSGNVWTYASLDLSPYAAESVRIAFDLHTRDTATFGTNPGPGWYIDRTAIVTGLPMVANPEDFEDGIGDWSAERGSWQIGTPTGSPDCHSDSLCAATVLDNNYVDNVDTRLISPPFIVPEADEQPSLLFWHWFSFGGGDNGEVQISTDGGVTWDSLHTVSGSSSGVWSPSTHDLTPHAGETAQIAFDLRTRDTATFGTNPGPGWYIDDLSILCGDDPCEGINLPVELVAFTARLDGSDAVLQWHTASETNNAGFDLEHRTETQPWRPLGFVEGHGTTTVAQRYSYRIHDLAPATHHFRLRQVDLDGAFAYSPDVSVVVEMTDVYQLSEIFPNPFAPRAQFTLAVAEPQHVRVELYNLLGQRMAVLHDGPLQARTEHRFTLDGRALTSGMYLVRATGETFAATRRATLIR